MKRFLDTQVYPHAVTVSAIFALTLAAYLHILGNHFQVFWDDAMYVTANEAVRGFSLSHLKSAIISNYAGNFTPLHIISYMLDYTFWGLNPKGFLLSNILLHAANGVLLYSLLIRLGWPRLAAAFSALVFCLHPVQVESVAWISERKNLLAMFFSLLSFSAYLSCRHKRWGEAKGMYFLSLGLFILALLSKSIAVVVPCLFLLFDICFEDTSERIPSLVAKIPFFLAALLIAWITIKYQSHGDVPGIGGGRVGYHGGSPLNTALTMLTVLVRYVGLLVWPTKLSAMYDPPVKTGVDLAVLSGGLVFILLLVTAIALYRRNRELFFWYAVFFLGLLPVSQIIPITTLMNDRYLYFPMLGAAPFFGWLIFRTLARIQGSQVVATAVGAVIVASCFGLSYARGPVWENDLTLWSDAAAKAPNHPIALYGKAQALQNSGNLEAALPLYLRVLSLNPKHPDSLIHVAALFRSKNDPVKGRPYLLELTRYYPNFSRGFLDLGNNYYLTGEFDAAEKALRQALVLEPKSAEAMTLLGTLYLRTKKLDAARECLEGVVSLGTTDANIEYNLACVESLSGRSAKALKHLQNAVRLGFVNTAEMERDPDLAAVRSLPEFMSTIRSPR
ncbi:O-GlcNAc transferase [Geomonas limicola]|uniref:O-GlcNAc transferase n=1 Tax=Geomonas limicola TaxID=2740186 RepID=A0A6V8NB67_9BACT|nr:tetratricopeptide repeat protein [Geomonas limicola]GFO69690.1 O-GlcNAc transferase [Geomonas limicola]